MSSTIQSIYNFRAISDQIATSGQPTENEIQAIAQAGFEVVINLALTTSDNALPNERELVKSQGMEYIHIPVIWERPTDADLASFLHVMAQQKDHKIFVHCAANMRVSVFMALYRILALGWPREKALQFVHEIWELNEIWSNFIYQSLNQ